MDFRFEVLHSTPSALIGLSVLAISGLRMIERSRLFHVGVIPLPFLLLGSGLLAYATTQLLCMGAAYVQRRLQYRRAWNDLMDDLYSISRWGGWSKTAERSAILLAWMHFKAETEALDTDTNGCSGDDDDDDDDDQPDDDDEQTADSTSQEQSDDDDDAADATSDEQNDDDNGATDATSNEQLSDDTDTTDATSDERHDHDHDDDDADVAATLEDQNVEDNEGTNVVPSHDDDHGEVTHDIQDETFTSQNERHRNNPDASDLDI